MARVTDLTNANLDSLRMSYTTWGKQFQDAMNVNGGDIDNATAADYVLHFLTFGWKVSNIETFHLTGYSSALDKILLFWT